YRLIPAPNSMSCFRSDSRSFWQVSVGRRNPAANNSRTSDSESIPNSTPSRVINTERLVLFFGIRLNVVAVHEILTAIQAELQTVFVKRRLASHVLNWSSVTARMTTAPIMIRL